MKGQQQSPVSVPQSAIPSYLNNFTNADNTTLFVFPKNTSIVPLLSNVTYFNFTVGANPMAKAAKMKNAFAMSDGKRYYLTELVVHNTNEHVINNTASALEIHFPLKSADNMTTILAFFVQQQLQKANTTQEPLLLELSQVTNKTQYLSKLPAFLNQTRGYIEYNGSLTYPPCSEHVRWLLFPNKIYANTTTIKAIREKLAIGARKATTYSPSFDYFVMNSSAPLQADPLAPVPTTTTTTTGTVTTGFVTTVSSTTSNTTTTTSSTTGKAGEASSEAVGSESTSPTSGTVVVTPTVTKSAAGAIVVSVLCALGFVACVVKDFRDRYEKNRP
eukprot:TRINITY_DN1743_c0_g1_i3.p1 TRINITY_DN1743_c0_g1~~TRINITY_DN1743_c0_g1_i3.p1  ORF type:complete len:331 (+),score=118.04 TRINITY_DN1743_c0_g1_i3:250-1242(+)